MRKLLLVAPLLALAAGAIAQKLLHRGIELNLLRAGAVAALLVVLDLLATRLGVRTRARGGHPVASLALAATGLAAIVTYPLEHWPSDGALAVVLGAFFLDVLAWRAFPDVPEADPSRRARLRRLFQLVMIAIGLPAIFVVGELGFRATGKYRSWLEENGLPFASPYDWQVREPWLLVYRPNAPLVQRQTEFTFEDTTNSLGLRDLEHPVAKGADEYRIVGLGDSFTMGEGARLEDTYLKVLERRLASRAKRVTVLSGGVEGSDPVASYQLLARRLVKYRPDLVLVTINGSDVYDVIARGGLDDRFDAQGAPARGRAPWFDGLFARSRVVRAVAISVFEYDWYLLRPRRREERAREAVVELERAIDAIRDLGKREGFETLVVVHPFHYQLQGDHAELEPLVQRLRERAIPWIDLFPWFREHVPEARVAEFFWPIDRHCTAKGYELMALGIERELDRVPGFPRGR